MKVRLRQPADVLSLRVRLLRRPRRSVVVELVAETRGVPSRSLACRDDGEAPEERRVELGLEGWTAVPRVGPGNGAGSKRGGSALEWAFSYASGALTWPSGRTRREQAPERRNGSKGKRNEPMKILAKGRTGGTDRRQQR